MQARKLALLFLTFLILIAVFRARASLEDLNNLRPPFEVPPLPYPASALEPWIDTRTMEIHHGAHHRAYVENLNKALKSWDKTRMSLLLRTVKARSEAVRNNAGGHWNHSFFWTVLTPDPEKRQMPKRLEEELKAVFGSIEAFQEQFEKSALARFGSGWTWLIRKFDGKLAIVSTPNQDNPLMGPEPSGYPILGVDVWEHAYYLKYQNKRGDYLRSFWKVVNWAQVDEYDLDAQKLIQQRQPGREPAQPKRPPSSGVSLYSSFPSDEPVAAN